MIKNKQSTRSFIAFLVTWAFVVLTVTGLVLYIVRQGRVAHWIHWSLLGLERRLQAFAESQGLDTGTAIKRLADNGIEAAPTDKIKAIAEMVGTRPIEIAKALLVTGYRPEPAQ